MAADQCSPSPPTVFLARRFHHTWGASRCTPCAARVASLSSDWDSRQHQGTHQTTASAAAGCPQPPAWAPWSPSHSESRSEEQKALSVVIPLKFRLLLPAKMCITWDKINQQPCAVLGLLGAHQTDTDRTEHFPTHLLFRDIFSNGGLIDRFSSVQKPLFDSLDAVTFHVASTD